MEPDLSVCVPTFNRTDHLPWTVGAAARMLRQHPTISFEVVVSDNHSPGAPAAFWDALTGEVPEARVVRPPQHLDTAEENLRFALPHCAGRYVWVLGDDDEPQAEGVSVLVDHVRRDDYAMVVFNSRSHDFEGRPIRDQQIACHAETWQGPLTAFVQRTGFWFVLAGFSTLLLRRPQNRLEFFDQALKTSKIYSHVCWLVGAYHAEPFAFANTPVVSYRQNHVDARADDHWTAVARREGTFFKGLWTAKFLQLMDLLVDAKVFPREFVGTIVDRNIGARFPLRLEIMRQFVEQLARDRLGSARPVAPEEFAYVRDWLTALFPGATTLQLTMEQARREHETTGLTEAQTIERLWTLLAHGTSRPWYAQFHVRTSGPYDLFHLGELYWAVRIDRLEAAEAALQSLDLRTSGLDLLTAESLPALQAAVDAVVEPATSSFGFEVYDRLDPLPGPYETFDGMMARVAGRPVTAAEVGRPGRGSIRPDRVHAPLRDEQDRSGAPLRRSAGRRGQTGDSRETLHRLQTEIAELRASSSWRITAPLRALAVWWRRPRPE